MGIKMYSLLSFALSFYITIELTIFMPYELIIAEKPSAMVKIAKALATGKPIKETSGKLSYYRITIGKKDAVVASSVGHVYGLAEKNKKKWSYPVFEVEWRPAYEVSRNAKYTKPYLDLIESLAKSADSFTIATDLDIEGETIGLNLTRFAFKKKDANRMKFSTLTTEDLLEAYNHKQKTLEWGFAKAGETRHILDWFYGINLSRALTLAVKKARGGGFKLLTSGRVQGPALKLIVEKEKEISEFNPDPYWEIYANLAKNNVQAMHSDGRIFDKSKADSIFNKVKDAKTAKVSEITSKRYTQNPPVPFDLTTLQTEAHKCLRIAPRQTMFLAQELYIGGYISYPRTSSQKLPAKLGFHKIISALSKNENYEPLCKILMKKKELIPNEGKKTDDAHPAIYPTGVKLPKTIGNQTRKLYDLVVRRFLSVFGDPAVRETNTVFFNINEEKFFIEGTRTVESNWHILYGSYVMLKDTDLPEFKKDEIVAVKKISKADKETTPPKRYSEASIIRALERENLGTKATRATIVETLFSRGYVKGKSIEATELGIKTVATLEKYCPKILDAAMTRHFEEEMDDIQHGKKQTSEVLDEAKDAVGDICHLFRKNEDAIGAELAEAEANSWKIANTLGACRSCSGGMLMMKKSKFGIFVGCSNYPDCKATFGLPKNSVVRPTDEPCPECSYPVVLVKPLKKREELVCINPKCITWTSEFKEKKKKQNEDEKLNGIEIGEDSSESGEDAESGTE